MFLMSAAKCTKRAGKEALIKTFPGLGAAECLSPAGRRAGILNVTSRGCALVCCVINV